MCSRQLGKDWKEKTNMVLALGSILRCSVLTKTRKVVLAATEGQLCLCIPVQLFPTRETARGCRGSLKPRDDSCW